MENSTNKQILHFMQLIHDNQNSLSDELKKMSTTIRKSDEKIPFEKHNELNVKIYNTICKNQMVLIDEYKKMATKIKKPSINNYQKTNNYILFNKDFLHKYQTYIIIFYIAIMLTPPIFFYIKEREARANLVECSHAYYELKRQINKK